MKRTSIGGQAVMEGVMMKNGNKYAVAVRTPNKDIEVDIKEYISFADKHKFAKLPIIRGVVNFVESLVVGIKTLTYSASFFEDDEETEVKVDKSSKENIEGIVIGFTVAFSLIMSVFLFMITPYLCSRIFSKFIYSDFWLNLIEGILRIVIFLGYIIAISFMEDIQRVFMYHGAEHKTINCLEAGVPLTPENIKNFSRLHKRCGTSFLFIVMIISIIFFMFIHVDGFWLKLLYRLLLVPIVAGISYEFIRLAGKSNSKIIEILSKPGMMLQKFTTREPSLDMLEVAIKSVEAVLDWKEYQKALNNGELE